MPTNYRGWEKMVKKIGTLELSNEINAKDLDEFEKVLEDHGYKIEYRFGEGEIRIKRK